MMTLQAGNLTQFSFRIQHLITQRAKSLSKFYTHNRGI